MLWRSSRVITIGAAPSKASFRADIQALRGVAVLLVVLYHSGLGILAAGYLGVDMFFVISGFLITGIITRQISEDRFSFVDFYSRRVRRLLPAAYTVLLVTTFAAAWLLTTSQYDRFLTNLAGSLFFSANYTLWSHTGYFASNSAFEPLLHMWSLAIEEQYYLLVPIILFIIPRRFWLAFLVTISALSFAGGLFLAATKPSVAFFWLPPRAWELGIGSIAALVWQKDHVRRVASALLIPGIAAILLAPVWRLPGPTPGLGAVLICFGAVIVILAQNELAGQSALVRGFSWIGDFSYSLYLVHWPLFALVRATRLSPDFPPLLSVLLIAIAFGLAWLLYRFIEEPLRRAPVSGQKLIAAALGGTFFILALAWALGQAKPDASGSDQLERPVIGLEQTACFSEEVAKFAGTCSQSPAPEMLLWGDSFSAHLVPGLVATARHRFVQASKGLCSPFVNYAAVATANEHQWTKRCLAFNASVIDYARRTPSLEVVILSGQYYRTMPAASDYAIRTATDGSIVRTPLGLDPTINAQRDTVATLRSFGLRVVVVTPPPPSTYNLGVCWQREAEALLIAGPYRGCQFRLNNPARVNQQFDEMMRGFEMVADVPLIRLEDGLCRDGRCQIEVDRKPLFRDSRHFTEWGSQVVGGRLNLGERAWAIAR